jgi:hypothetical protein
MPIIKTRFAKGGNVEKANTNPENPDERAVIDATAALDVIGSQLLIKSIIGGGFPAGLGVPEALGCIELLAKSNSVGMFMH